MQSRYVNPVNTALNLEFVSMSCLFILRVQGCSVTGVLSMIPAVS